MNCEVTDQLSHSSLRKPPGSRWDLTCSFLIHRIVCSAQLCWFWNVIVGVKRGTQGRGGGLRGVRRGTWSSLHVGTKCFKRWTYPLKCLLETLATDSYQKHDNTDMFNEGLTLKGLCKKNLNNYTHLGRCSINSMLHLSRRLCSENRVTKHPWSLSSPPSGLSHWLCALPLQLSLEHWAVEGQRGWYRLFADWWETEPGAGPGCWWILTI